MYLVIKSVLGTVKNWIASRVSFFPIRARRIRRIRTIERMRSKRTIERRSRFLSYLHNFKQSCAGRFQKQHRQLVVLSRREFNSYVQAMLASYHYTYWIHDKNKYSVSNSHLWTERRILDFLQARENRAETSQQHEKDFISVVLKQDKQKKKLWRYKDCLGLRKVPYLPTTL